MAFQLTLTAKSLANQISIKPNLILEIEGLDLVFGVQPILEALRWDNGQNWDDEGLRWDGLIEKPESRAYLNFKKSTRNITQQILIDKGGSSSVSTMNICIVNKDAEVTKALSFENFTEILGRRCNVYLNYAEGQHPEDSIPIFRGYIDDYADESAAIYLSVSHSENLKRQRFLEQYNSVTTEKVKYKELTIQDIFLDQRNKLDSLMSIEYIAGSPLSVVLNGNKITATITPTTTAKQLLTAIRANVDVNARVESNLVGNENNIQVAQAETSFNIDTQIKVESTAELIESGDALTTYLQIDDEIMRVVSIDDDFTFTVQRGELGSLSDKHDNSSDIASVYTLEGDPIDLALKVMLSEEGNEYYESEETIEAFRYVDDQTDLPGAIIFSNYNIEESTGLTVGDSFIIENSTNNNGTYEIESFGVLDDGRSYIIAKDNALVVETDSEPEFSYLSKYAVMPTGLGMLPNEVDVKGFETIKQYFNPNFTEYLFKIKDTIDDGKDWIDSQLFFPQGLYSIPRKARVSVNFTAPPLSTENIPTLDYNTIVDLKNVKQKRSTHKYFYNGVVAKYNKNVFDDKFKSSIITLDEDSKNRIKVGNEIFTIESDGLQRNTQTQLVIERISQRILDRYKFSARFFENVQVLYKTGYALEIGDVVSLGGENTQLTNLETGERNFPIALYEIVNKSMDIEGGKILLTLLETGFSTSGRFGVISPASQVLSGTSTRIVLKSFLDCGEYDNEGQKWALWVGCKLRVRSKDYTQDATVDFLGFDPSNADALIISALPFTPSENMFVELANYDEQPLTDIGDKLKLKYTFLMEQQFVTAQIDNQSFEANIGGLVEGQGVLIHNDDYTNDSIETKIETIVGNIVTLVDALSFAPDVNYKIETLDFASDSGDGYRYL